MRTLSAKTYAKINLTLDVIRRRDDSYHDLEMIMQSVGLFDVLTISENSGKDINVGTNSSFVAKNEQNIAYKAAQKVFSLTGVKDRGIDIYIEKSIPVSAGLAGGSSNAAGVIVLLNEMFSLGLSDADIKSAARDIGADVTFCLFGGTALAQGIGDELTFLPDMPDCHIVLAKPNAHVSTHAAFSKLDVGKIGLRPDTHGALDAIKSGDIFKLSRRLYNVLEEAAAKDIKDIHEIKSVLYDEGALGASMSGSGPSVFAIFDDEEKAKSSGERLLSMCESVHLIAPVNRGVEIL